MIYTPSLQQNSFIVTMKISKNLIKKFSTSAVASNTAGASTTNLLRKDIKFNKLSSWPDLSSFKPRLDVGQGEDPMKAGLPTEAEILEIERQKAVKRMYEGGKYELFSVKQN